MYTKNATFSMLVAGVIEGLLKRDERSLMELYNKTMISSPTWARLRRGQAKIDLEQLYNIQEVFGYQMQDVLKYAEQTKAEIERKNVRIMPPEATDRGRIKDTDLLAIAGFSLLLFAAIAVLSKNN